MMIEDFPTLELLQLVGLTLPAIGIYMQVVYGESTPGDDDFDIVMQGVYHQARLAVLCLLIGALILLSFVFAPQPGDFPIDLLDWVLTYRTELYASREPITKISWVFVVILIIIQHFFKLTSKKRILYNCYPAMLIGFFVFPFVIVSPIATIAITPIALGMILFAGVVGFEHGGRNTQKSIIWGLYEFWNHLIGAVRNGYSDGNRFFPQLNGEPEKSQEENGWVVVHEGEVDGTRYRIQQLND